MSTHVTCPTAETLVSYLYGEFEPGARPGRDAVEHHLETCATCAQEVASLGGVRTQLASWVAPEVELGFKVVPTAPARTLTGPRRWFTWSSSPLPAAAAAVLVLAAALGLARLDVQYDSQGLRIRTGWGHQTPSGSEAQAVAAASTAPAAHERLAAPAPAASPVGLSEADLVALEARLRQRLGQTVTPASVATGDPVTGKSASATDAELLRRVRQIIDESEVRQQQNLQLRVSELMQDFELQRKADLVSIEQNFGRLTSESAQQRQFLNQYMRNVSATGRLPQ